MSIYDIGDLLIFISILTLVIYFSKYYRVQLLPKFIKNTQVISLTLFLATSIINFIISYMILSKLNSLYLTRVTDDVDTLILAAGTVLSIALISLINLIEMDNIILENKDHAYSSFFRFTRNVLVIVASILTGIIVFLIVK